MVYKHRNYGPRYSGTFKQQKKRHFHAPSHIRRVIMSAPLSKELRLKHNVKRLPIRRDDEVMVKVGGHRDREGKVVTVYRKKYKIYIDRVTRENSSGESKMIPIHPSNVMIIKIKMDKDRKALLERRGAAREFALKVLEVRRQVKFFKDE
eukprot:Trichotokara_eunicae@DN6924_c0_g1_i1.p1